MWSDSNRDYVKSLIETNRAVYPYYITHTCTYWGISNSSSLPSFKVYFSKEPIRSSGLYTYVLPSDTVVYSVIGGNANGNYHNSRVSVSKISGSLTVDSYEFVYTNAETAAETVQPDLLASSTVKQSHFDGVSLIILVVLLSSIFVKLIRR